MARWLLLLLLAGCAQIQYVPVPLPLPPEPVLPAVPGAALQCLAADTYTDLVTREVLIRDYAEQLETIIKSTREEH